MTYEEKGKWVYLTVSTLAFVTYVGIILSKAQNMALAEVSYASTLLWVLGISITVTILSQIAIAIAKPGEADRKDIRDKEINRFGDNVGGIVLGVAMIVPFLFALNGVSHFWIANTMYAAFLLSAVVSSIVKIVAYRRGL